jgi:hypothetical protein
MKKRSVKSKRDYNPADKSTLIWMTCSNEGCSNESFVDDSALGTICSNCVMKGTLSLLSEKEKDKVFGVTTQKKSPFPRGWKWMNEFVDGKGNVYYKGKEQPKLKGSKPITDMLAMKNRQKANKEKRAETEQKKLLVMAAKKKALKKAIKKQQDFVNHKVEK